ncbi:HlyC/CorC family transporter [Candidatus Sumerlaeota bacterium]|nr:HlyC/CorC family transporter [Candidatus Sumerlaeota bacterium]
MPVLPLLFLVAALLVLSAALSAAEAALFALPHPGELRGRMRPFQRLLDRGGRTLSGLLLLNTLTNVGVAVVWAMLWMAALPGLSTPMSIALAVVTGAPLILIVGEVLPRTVALWAPESVALWVGRPASALLFAIAPLRLLMDGLANAALWITGDRRGFTEALREERKVKTYVAMGGPEGTLEEDEREMVEGVLEFGETTAEDVMTPRTEVRFVSLSDGREAIEAVFVETGHSRVPVRGESPDEVVGFLHHRDLLLSEDRPLEEMLRAPLTVPPAVKLDTLLERFRERQTFIAVVIDEYGGTEGIVTLNDVLEAIVGEIEEETNGDEGENGAPEEPIRQGESGEWIVWGRVEIEELNEALPRPLPEDRARTLSGFMVNSLGRIPAEGEKAELEGWEFHVRRMSGPRIEEIALRPHGSRPETPSSEGV